MRILIAASIVCAAGVAHADLLPPFSTSVDADPTYIDLRPVGLQFPPTMPAGTIAKIIGIANTTGTTTVTPSSWTPSLVKLRRPENLSGTYVVQLQNGSANFPPVLPAVGIQLNVLPPVFTVARNNDVFTFTGTHFATPAGHAYAVLNLPATTTTLTTLPTTGVTELTTSGWSDTTFTARFPSAPSPGTYGFVVKTSQNLLGVGTTRIEIPPIPTLCTALSTFQRTAHTDIRIPAQAALPGDAATYTALIDGAVAPLTKTLDGGRASLRVTWRILDENRAPLAPSQGVLTPNGSNASVLLRPQFDTAKTRYLTGTIDVTVANCSPISLPLPQIPLRAPLVPSLPTFVLAFRYANFGIGMTDPAVLLMSPDGEFKSADVLTKIQPVLDIVSKLRTVTAFSGELGAWITGIDVLRTTLEAFRAAPHELPKVARAVDDLGGWYPLIYSWPAHVNCEDIFRSMIVIGGPNKTVHFFNNKKFNSDQGQLDVNTGMFGIAVLKDLTPAITAAGQTLPVIGGGTATAITKPTGSYYIVTTVSWPANATHTITSFGAELSSIKMD